MMARNSLITALMKLISEDYPGIKRQEVMFDLEIKDRAGPKCSSVFKFKLYFLII